VQYVRGLARAGVSRSFGKACQTQAIGQSRTILGSMIRHHFGQLGDGRRGLRQQKLFKHGLRFGHSTPQRMRRNGQSAKERLVERQLDGLFGKRYCFFKLPAKEERVGHCGEHDVPLGVPWTQAQRILGAIESDVVASEVNMQKTRLRPAEGMVGVQRQALIYETEPFFRKPALAADRPTCPDKNVRICSID
jgi:hypothetical protein